MHTLFYFLRESVRGLVQAKLITAVAILTTAVALFVAGISLIAAQNLRWWFARTTAEVRLVAFLADSTSASASRTEQLVELLEQMPEVETVIVVSKEDAMRRFTDAYGSTMLAAVEGNPLPASLEVQPAAAFRSAAAVQRLIDRIAGLPGVTGVTYLRDWLERLEVFGRWLWIGTIVLALVVAGALYFTIANSVRLTIYARRDLVSNMRMVGATDLYIALPFVLEGVIQGFAGAAVAVFLLYVAGACLSRLPMVWHVWHVYAVLLGAGPLFGWMGSAGAVRKFLS